MPTQPQIISPETFGHIRHAHHKDVSAILTLEELFPTDRMSLNSWKYYLKSPKAIIWVAELDGAVVGNLLLVLRKNHETARIMSVVVAPQARGRKFAERLILGVEKEAAQKHFSKISLEVRVDNEPAINLYKKLGYEIVSKKPNYYSDGVDGYKMVKNLSINT